MSATGRPLNVGLISSAHLHALSYVHGFATMPGVELVGIWDDDAERGQKFGADFNLKTFETLESLGDACDALLICSENRKHADHIEFATSRNLPFICEKPIATTPDEAARIRTAIQGFTKTAMTAFPCRYSPAYESLKARVARGEIGEVRAICATNRGTCPFGWFTEPELSGGGAMIDHVVHVTDLLRDLLSDEVATVQAQINHRMYNQKWEDCALLTLGFGKGVFATLDSSWSRPDGFRTWGDVTMNVVGDAGVIELDMFGQEIHRYGSGPRSHSVGSFGSNMDALLVQEFINAVREELPGKTTLEDGLIASEVAIAGYRSVAERAVVAVA